MSKPTKQRISDHRELRVWQISMKLVTDVYASTRAFPSVERFGLALQLRRAAVAVAANIAEGNGRVHRKEYIHHLSIARGSLRETETLLEIARRLNYVGPADTGAANEMIDHVGRMLARMIKSLAASTG
jgi:four helix bundle protein